MQIINKNTSSYLDLLRGIAAMIVFVGHLRNLFLVDYPNVAHPNLALQLVYLVTGFGHQAVIIFFVLSGLLITSSIQKARAANRWSWRSYLVARSTRLLLVLIPALLLGALWDQLGMFLFGVQGIYGANPAVNGNVISAPVNERSTWLIGLGNVLFLQEIRVPTFGSNGALWSLSYEFWYYLLFPLGLTALLANRSWIARAGAALAFMLIAFFIGPTITLYFIIWLMGAALVVTPRLAWLANAKRVQLVNVAGIGLIMLTLLAIKANVISDPVAGDFVLAVTVALLVYFLLHTPTSTAKPTRGRFTIFAKLTAGFSYTLYAVHLPLLVFIQAGLIHTARWQPDLVHLVYLLGLGALGLLYAFLISRVTEARTDQVRKWVLAQGGLH